MLAPPELKQVHPLGKSPVITDGKLTLAESGAILQYLVDEYDTTGRLQPKSAADRAASPTGCTTPRARRCRRC
jgi:glutathione S-transferase